MHTINFQKIPIAGPSITEKEIAYVKDAVMHGWYENANEYIERFETGFAKFTGRKYAISLPSCTSGLHLTLLAVGIKEGDEVIVPDITWIATAAPISYVRATPVFADIDPKTWCLSARSIEAAITKKTKAIIVVNLYGNMPEWDEILLLAKKHNIYVIEDAAESIGSHYKNKLSGSFGHASCFSFHGSKTLTTGEGGILLTDDDAIYNKCLILRDHGRNPGDIMFRNIEVGYKYKMSALQAALGLAQLERINELVDKKRQIFSWYQNALKGIESIQLNPYHPDVYNSYWMTTMVFHTLGYDKDCLMQTLKKQGIQTRPFFDPLSKLQPYKNIMLNANEKNKVAYTISPYAINLPSALSLTQAQVGFVCENIINLYTQLNVN